MSFSTARCTQPTHDRPGPRNKCQAVVTKLYKMVVLATPSIRVNGGRELVPRSRIGDANGGASMEAVHSF